MTNNRMPYLIEAYPGKYFKDSNYDGWDFTTDASESDLFIDFESAQEHAETLERAILVTYWDYDDIPPQPKVIPYPLKDSLQDESIRGNFLEFILNSKREFHLIDGQYVSRHIMTASNGEKLFELFDEGPLFILPSSVQTKAMPIISHSKNRDIIFYEEALKHFETDMRMRTESLFKKYNPNNGGI